MRGIAVCSWLFVLSPQDVNMRHDSMGITVWAVLLSAGCSPEILAAPLSRLTLKA